MNREQLNEALSLHKARLNGDRVDRGLRYADTYNLLSLRDADLQHLNLRNADLRYISFYKAKLQYCDFRNANLRFCGFEKAEMSHCNLKGADLRDSCFRDVDLRDVDLRGVDLRGAHLDYTLLPKGWGSMKGCYGRHPVNWSPEKIYIGYEAHTRDEWDSFTDNDISELSRIGYTIDVSTWSGRGKRDILAAYDASQAELRGDVT